MEKDIKKMKYGLKSHNARFGTEKLCRDYLVSVKWNGVPKCHHCNNSFMNYFITTRNIWKCSSCRKQFSVRKNTIFEGSNLSLVDWFKALYYFATFKRGISSCQMARLLEIEQRSAWFLLHRLREVIKDENDSILDGIVEIDEAYIGPIISLDLRLQRAKKLHDAEQERIHGLGKKKQRRIRGVPAKRGRKPGSTKEVLEQKKLEQEQKGKRIPFETPKVILGFQQRGGNVVLKALGLSNTVVTKDNIYPLIRKHITEKSILYTDQ